MASVAAGSRSVRGEIRPLPAALLRSAGSLLLRRDTLSSGSGAGAVHANGPSLSWLVCNDLWLHLYANTNNLLLS